MLLAAFATGCRVVEVLGSTSRALVCGFRVLSKLVMALAPVVSVYALLARVFLHNFPARFAALTGRHCDSRKYKSLTKVVCGGVRWCAMVCDGLRRSAVVCGGLRYCSLQWSGKKRPCRRVPPPSAIHLITNNVPGSALCPEFARKITPF